MIKTKLFTARMLSRVLFWSPLACATFLFLFFPATFSVAMSYWPVEPDSFIAFLPFVFAVSMTACVNFNVRALGLIQKSDNQIINEEIRGIMETTRLLARDLIYTFTGLALFFILFKADLPTVNGFDFCYLFLFLFLNLVYWFFSNLIDVFQAQLLFTELELGLDTGDGR